MCGFISLLRLKCFSFTVLFRINSDKSVAGMFEFMIQLFISIIINHLFRSL